MSTQTEDRYFNQEEELDFDTPPLHGVVSIPGTELL